jgi:hypothetical protein
MMTMCSRCFVPGTRPFLSLALALALAACGGGGSSSTSSGGTALPRQMDLMQRDLPHLRLTRLDTG